VIRTDPSRMEKPVMKSETKDVADTWKLNADLRQSGTYSGYTYRVVPQYNLPGQLTPARTEQPTSYLVQERRSPTLAFKCGTYPTLEEAEQSLRNMQEVYPTLTFEIVPEYQTRKRCGCAECRWTRPR
jgi:hypothetical protein